MTTTKKWGLLLISLPLLDLVWQLQEQLVPQTVEDEVHEAFLLVESPREKIDSAFPVKWYPVVLHYGCEWQ
jgi:hypothetical protein